MQVTVNTGLPGRPLCNPRTALMNQPCYFTPRHNESNVIRDWPSTVTPDTIPITLDSSPITNGLSPGRVGGGGDETDRNEHFKLIQNSCNRQFEINNAVLQQLTLTQDFLRAKGKKGFRFTSESEHYESLITVYHEKTASESLTDGE